MFMIMYSTTEDKIRGILKNMLFYYYENMGSTSEIGGCKITPKLVAKITERYLELGGVLPSEHYEVYWAKEPAM